MKQIVEFKRLSKVTIGFAAYIVVSAAFMLQVRNWLMSAFADPLVMASFKVFFALIFVLMLVFVSRKRLSLIRVCVVCIVFILGYLFAMWQPYFAEKTHVLTYGLLGYLAAKDLVDPQRILEYKNIALAVCFVALISALDEIFQGFLPYRVCDTRDFITNIISAALGISLLLGLHWENRETSL
jgi:VanZ family protein